MKKFWERMFGNFQQQAQKEEKSAISEDAQRALQMEKTLLELIKTLHGKRDTTEIIMDAFKTICLFYDADWVGILDIDTEVGVWMPICWYNYKVIIKHVQ